MWQEPSKCERVGGGEEGSSSDLTPWEWALSHWGKETWLWVEDVAWKPAQMSQGRWTLAYNKCKDLSEGRGKEHRAGWVGVKSKLAVLQKGKLCCWCGQLSLCSHWLHSLQTTPRGEGSVISQNELRGKGPFFRQGLSSLGFLHNSFRLSHKPLGSFAWLMEQM